jgi:hypothetical protein
LNEPAHHPILDLDAIAHALTADPAIRQRLIRDYGLPADLSGQELIDALLVEFDQAPAEDPFEEMRSPRSVFRAAVRSLGSNSRNWLHFARREPELAALLHDYDPVAAQNDVRTGDLTADGLGEFFPGITRRRDAAAVLRWAERLSERNFGSEARAVAMALDHLHEAEHGASLPADRAMPTIALLLADPRKSWDGWDLLPAELLSLTTQDLKLPGMGPTLGTEFFRNLRWSGFKPDRHVMRLLDRWAPEVVEAQEPAARRLAGLAGRRDRTAIEFLQYSLAGQAVTPRETALSVADNMIWALGAYVEKKGRESGTGYVRQDWKQRRAGNAG